MSESERPQVDLAETEDKPSEYWRNELDLRKFGSF